MSDYLTVGIIVVIVGLLGPVAFGAFRLVRRAERFVRRLDFLSGRAEKLIEDAGLIVENPTEALRPLVIAAVEDALARIDPEALMERAVDRATDRVTLAIKDGAKQILKDPSEITNKIFAGFVEKLAADAEFRTQVHAAETFFITTAKEAYFKKGSKGGGGGMWGEVLGRVIDKFLPKM